jgi:general secretion pathway protein C
MDWAKLNSQLQGYLAKIPQQHAITGLLVALIIYIAYLSAQITWLFVPKAEMKSAAIRTPATIIGQTSMKVDVAAIKALNLFGRAPQKSKIAEVKKVEVEDAPPTRLKLTLTGVAASNDDSVAAAIIESSGQQETYGVGEKIKGTRATLRKVMPDRVIIEQSGKHETLMLDGFKYQKLSASKQGAQKNNAQVKSSAQQALKAPSPTAGSNDVVDLRRSQAVRERVAELKDKLANDPGKITDYIKISPKRVEGKTVGYRLMPGKDKEFFTESGLKPGDVAVEINGKDLSDPKAAGQAMMELRKAEDVVLVIDRQGVYTEILFSLRK